MNTFFFVKNKLSLIEFLLYEVKKKIFISNKITSHIALYIDLQPFQTPSSVSALKNPFWSNPTDVFLPKLLTFYGSITLNIN